MEVKQSLFKILHSKCVANLERLTIGVDEDTVGAVPMRKKFVSELSMSSLINLDKRTNMKRTNYDASKPYRLKLQNNLQDKLYQSKIKSYASTYIIFLLFIVCLTKNNHALVKGQTFDVTSAPISSDTATDASDSDSQTTAAASCFGGLQTFEKISMSTFENPSPSSGSSNSYGSGILIQQDDQALTSECVNLCRSQSNCLSFVIDYNKFECKSYATTQQELQQEYDFRYQSSRSINNSTINTTDSNGYQSAASSVNMYHLLPSASSNYFEKICLDGVADRNQFNEVCGQGRLWIVERVVDSFLDGFVEKEVTNVNNKDECSKLCVFETQFVCRSADYEQHSRLCRLSKEDRRTQPQAMRSVAGSNRQYLENQCATPGPSSCVYETKRNVGVISMDALKFAQTVQDCQMKCNQEPTFNCRSYSFHQQRCFLSGDDSSSLKSNSIKLPSKQGWQFGEKKCLVELCTKGIFSYEKIVGYTLRSALSTPIDLMMPADSSLSMVAIEDDLEHIGKMHQESNQTRLYHLLYNNRASKNASSLVNAMMMMMSGDQMKNADPLQESASSHRRQRSLNNLAVTGHCRHSCDLSYLNCPAFTVDYRNNRCQRLDRNSQGRHHELVARDGFSYYEKICLRVPEMMSMCQDKYWIFERVIGYELAPRLYEKSLKFVQSRRDCQEYCLEEKQFQCRSALYNDETSDCKLSRYDRRLSIQEGGYYKNFNARVSYLENQCIRDHVAEKQQHCLYEQTKDEPAYPSFTEHIEMVTLPKQTSNLETESVRQVGPNATITSSYGASYCEQLCNENSKFECHSFGYYMSTAQCFLSGDDSVSAGEAATTPSSGFIYFEKKCRLDVNASGQNEDPMKVPNSPPTTSEPQNPYFQPTSNNNNPLTINPSDNSMKPMINNNISTHKDPSIKPQRPLRPAIDLSNETGINPDQYKCGNDNTFVYQRISGFEPIGGYLTLLVKNDDQPGIVSECADLCKRAFECRAFVVDYNSNQCFAMLENSSVGMLSLRQTIGKDYFEGFCVSDHILMSGHDCRNKTWVIDKIVDQAVIGVQHQKLIMDTDRALCRQACLEERLFWCKSALFDAATSDCKLYSIDRESTPQMRLLFTKGVDFFENQCQIISSSCPYDAIERDMTMVTITKSIQASSTLDCENECNDEVKFNCRSYTYLEQNPSLPNMCLLSSDSRSTSQKGSVKEHQKTLYAERNCYYRRPRYPGNQRPEPTYVDAPSVGSSDQEDPYQIVGGTRIHSGHSSYEKNLPPKVHETFELTTPVDDVGPALGQGCEPHQYTFERTFGYDFRLAQKEKVPIVPTIGIAISCQQECLRRGDKCLSFVVDYALPHQGCFLIENQVGSNKKLLVKSHNSVYFEKVCLPRTGLDMEPPTNTQYSSNLMDSHPLDMAIAPSYSSEPWSPQIPNQLPYYLQQQQLVQNYPSRSCAKLWSFERFINHNFTAPGDKILDNILSRAQCETFCLNEANFNCRSATYDYSNKICRLFKNTRRTIMSHFVDLESMVTSTTSVSQISSGILQNSQPGTVQILADDIESASRRRQTGARQSSSLTTAEASDTNKDIDYLENTCIPEPSSCQYRQLYDLFSPYIDKLNYAVSLSDCQRQCDLERLFSCKSINYDPSSKNCMLINEDLISLSRGQQTSLLPKKNYIYSEKGNCELISVQCNSQEMLVSINFDSPFRGRVMAKGNPEQCFLMGDGQTSVQFSIIFGPKCNSRQEGHNTFVNEVVIQQHPIIMTDSDKTIRVMCAFEALDQTITLKNPSSRDNKTGIDVGTPESSRIRHDKLHFNSVVSNKASPPSVLLRILDQNGRDASTINLGDDLTLRIQMQMDGQNSALGIFARNLAARSSNGETLLLIDNDGCPVDPLVFPALETDPKDGKSLLSTFKAFRFPSSGLVNFEVQIRFCPERCQPVECHKGFKAKSYGRKKRDVFTANDSLHVGRTSIIQSSNQNQVGKNPLDALSTVMKPGKAFQYVRELLLPQEANKKVEYDQEANHLTGANDEKEPTDISGSQNDATHKSSSLAALNSASEDSNTELKTKFGQPGQEQHIDQQANNEFLTNQQDLSSDLRKVSDETSTSLPQSFQKSILMHVDEKVVPSVNFANHRGLNHPHSPAPYGRFPIDETEEQLNRHYVNQQTNGLSPSYNDDQIPTTSNPTIDNPMDPHSPIGDYTMKDKDSLSTEPMSDLTRVESTDNGQNRIVKPQNAIDNTYSNQGKSRDLPLRFSILVGENQAPSRGWIPSGQMPVTVRNSTSHLDHIVIPGKDGQFEINASSDSRTKANTDLTITTQNTALNYNEDSYSNLNELKHAPGIQNEGTSKRNTTYDQTFDALPSNSVAAEVKINQVSSQTDATINKNRLDAHPNTAASHDCRIESGSSKLWTIIWTGTFVIVFNICLVILSLVLYFRQVHLRHNHNIVRATSECGTYSTSGRGWPSVLLKSKNNLGTSLSTHEHFFCKLNSKPTTHSRTNGHEFNWPNLSTSSSHSTISSLASPLPVTSIKINQTCAQKPLFDTQSSMRNNFNPGNKSTLEVGSFDCRSKNLRASYTDNIDDSQSETFQSMR